MGSSGSSKCHTGFIASGHLDLTTTKEKHNTKRYKYVCAIKMYLASSIHTFSCINLKPDLVTFYGREEQFVEVEDDQSI